MENNHVYEKVTLGEGRDWKGRRIVTHKETGLSQLCDNIDEIKRFAMYCESPSKEENELKLLKSLDDSYHYLKCLHGCARFEELRVIIREWSEKYGYFKLDDCFILSSKEENAR